MNKFALLAAVAGVAFAGASFAKEEVITTTTAAPAMEKAEKTEGMTAEKHAKKEAHMKKSATKTEAKKEDMKAKAEAKKEAAMAPTAPKAEAKKDEGKEAPKAEMAPAAGTTTTGTMEQK
jgi:hypothetical protein